MRNCNQYHYFFSLKKYVLSQKKGLQKRGGFTPFPANYFFKKIDLKIIFLHTAEAVTGSCSVKKVFLEIWQNSQENTCGRVSFSIKLQALLKKRLWRRCFPVDFAKFLRTPFLIEHLRWLLLTPEFLKIVFSSIGSPNLQL